jgi:protein involved in polysaccharide export with SLBB domain
LDAAGGLFQLNPYDLVSIRPDPYFSSQRKVTISGEVLYPGEYTIINSNEKITDIIERAGGLLPNAFPNASQYTRQGIKINASLAGILKNPKSKLNFDVQNGDEIMIVPHPNVVMITGEVNTSGIHKYVPGKRLRYYLKLAGGINPDADKNNIWVEYPNRDSKKYNQWSLLSPKVIDGSSIVVGKQKEAEPFDRTEFAKEMTAILANLAQTVVVVVLAVR